MSLLIKALEQAAKDRDSAKAASPSAAASAPSTEPTLEPPPAPRSPHSAHPPSEGGRIAVNSTGSTVREPSSLSSETRAANRPTAEASALAHIDAQHQRARAAAVIEASRSSSSMLFSYLRGSPVVMFGTAAAVFGIGFGIYVYLQIAQPGLFVRQAATKPPDTSARASASQVPTQTSAPSAPAAETASVGTASAEPMAAAQLNPGPVAAPAVSAATAPSTGQVLAAAAERNPAPIPASAVIASAGARDVAFDPAVAAPAAARERPPQSGRSKATMGREATKPQSAAVAGPADGVSGRRDQIAVSPSAAQPRIDPALTQAYAALQLGKLDEARTSYAKLSQAEPLNIDALLGLAYIATQENRSDDAMRLYLRILQVNPRHAAAQGALIGLMGRADPVASETRLKQLIAREPSPFLHFILGNLYADQGMWAQAQLAYYQAHHLEPDNPDYAYNLAVGLDHLRQNKLAVGFYRRAEQLATALGRANFDVTHARERIGILSSQLE